MKKTTLEKISERATLLTGSSGALIIAFGIVVLWLVTGPIFNYSDAWQLTINTFTTITTFLMVFLIQRSQNKESISVQLKLNELVAALKGASNHLIDVEDLSEKELQILHKHYMKLAKMADEHKDIKESHSIEEAETRHKLKIGK